jgi:hypothetical protein
MNNVVVRWLVDLNKDVPWGVFGLIVIIAIVGAAFTIAFMVFALPLPLKHLTFQVHHWWPWH